MFIDLKRMNLYLLTFFWLSFGLVLLTIILPATLVTPGPNLGSLAPAAFYGAATAGWVIPVTPTCVTTPSTNYSGVRRLSNDNFAPGERSPLSTLSNLAWAFGQLVMEDMVVLTPNNAAASPIVVALSDLGVNVTMDVVPVVTRSGIGNTTNPWGCAEVPNNVSALLDCSWLYGDSTQQAAVVREGVNGRLRMSSGGNLPINGVTGEFVAANSALANENVVVSALMDAFLLEHNRWANELHALNSGLSDDILFYKARSIVIAQYQAILYNEWIPFVLGAPPPAAAPPVAPPPQVSLEFALLGTQFYKTMINGDAGVVYGNTTHQILQQTVRGVLLGAWQSAGRQFDSYVASTIANNSIPYDFIAEVLALSQQVGLAPYVNIRASIGNTLCIADASRWGGPALASFFNESLPLGQQVGCGTSILVSDQLRRSIAADPYWFSLPHMRRYLSPTWYEAITQTRMVDILTRNFAITAPTGAPTDSAFLVRR